MLFATTILKQSQLKKFNLISSECKSSVQLKKFFNTISVANKRREELLDLSVKLTNLPLTLLLIRRLLNQFGPRHRDIRTDKRSMGSCKSRMFFFRACYSLVFFWRWTLSYSSMSMVFAFTAFDVSPRGQCDFSDIFTEDVVGMQISREQDSI